MAKVIGVGGVFFLCKDVEATRAWYSRVLGIDIDSDYGGSSFNHSRSASAFPQGAMTIWSPFRNDSDYFKPSKESFMINLMVDDLAGVVKHLKTQDVPLVGGIDEEPYGKFAWIMDIDGRKVELWEPKEDPQA